MLHKIDTVIVGGGQAGLAMSYYLTQEGCEHVLLERAPAVASTTMSSAFAYLCIAAHIAASDSRRREYNTRSGVLCDVVNRVARTGRGLTNNDHNGHNK